MIGSISPLLLVVGEKDTSDLRSILIRVELFSAIRFSMFAQSEQERVQYFVGLEVWIFGGNDSSLSGDLRS